MRELGPKIKRCYKAKYNKPLLWLNVGSNEEISIGDLAKKIAKLVGFKGEILWDKTKKLDIFDQET